jgi:DNA repair protein RadC
VAAIFKKYDVRLIQEHSGRYDLEKKITSPGQAADICRRLYDMDALSYEKTVMITLNTQLQVVGCFEVSRGTIDQAAVYPREVATRALLTNAKAVILAHNHPSGSLTPSEGDIRTTERIRNVLEMLSINLVDHIIITHSNYYSLAENGQL